MTAPRWVLPGETYMLTRRCSQRQFLLAPSPEVNEVFRYCLAVAASRFGILVHAVAVLSNHYHVIASDPDGELPRFMHLLNLLVAKAMNVKHKRGENFWSNAPYSAVRLGNSDSVLDKIVYTLANPIEAGLVANLREWPGVVTQLKDLAGGRWVCERPAFFFRQKGQPDELPAAVELTFTKPPAFADMPDEEFRQVGRTAFHSRVRAIKKKRVEQGKHGFLGREAVLAQVNNPFATSGSSRPKRGLCPRLACRDKWRRIELCVTLTDFYASYRRAWAAWRDGRRDVVFPAGTYLMRVLYGVTCAPT